MMSILVDAYLSMKERFFWMQSQKSLDSIYKRVSERCEIKRITPPQRAEIQSYWKPLIGKEVTTRWHEMIYSYTGHFSPTYEPFDICQRVQVALSGKNRSLFDDKGLYRSLLNGFNFGERIAECSYGVCYLPLLKGWKETSFKEVCHAMSDIDDCIIKPARGSSGGSGVRLFSTQGGVVNGTEEAVEQLLKKYAGNFVVEKKICECENLQALNNSSCNTIRVHTYRNRKSEEIRYISSHVRIGKAGSVVDNMDAGGICAKIHPDGCLHGAVSIWPYKHYSQSPSGINISNYKIEDWEIIKQTCIAAHSMLPMYDLVGWDAVTDRDGKVVFIEFNPNPDMRMEQCIYGGSCLAEHQIDVMQQVFGL